MILDENEELENAPDYEYEEPELDDEFIGDTEVGALLDAKTKRSFRIERADYEIEEFSTPAIHTAHADKYYEDLKDSFEYNRKKNLNLKIDELFKKSSFCKIIKSKDKIPASYFPKIYAEIREQLDDDSWMENEIFMEIAEYLHLKVYESFYKSIPNKYKERLLKELDDKYGSLKLKNNKNLF